MLLLLMAIYLHLWNNVYSLNNQIPRNLDMPKEIIIISQSGTMYQLWITAIDLSNNELIILIYSHSGSESEIENVIRTGIKIDPSKQLAVKGTDGPFKKPEK